MTKHSRLTLAKNDILSLFSGASQKIYSEAQLAGVLKERRRLWRLADSTTTNGFIAFLEKQGDLRTHKFRSEAYKREITRYSWGKATNYELALALKPRAYLCHGTAAAVHGLAKVSPQMIYLNAEQSPKPSHGNTLTQHGLDLAFSRKQRESNLIYTYNGISVTMIAGKNTNRLGVEEIYSPSSEALAVTTLERTLIDIVVRPAYAGGILQVFKAYCAAKDSMSTHKLLGILETLDYVYPYHQAIGFLMQKADYPVKEYTTLCALGLSHDFYLAHGMKQPEYSKDWRLFYPKGIKG